MHHVKAAMLRQVLQMQDGADTIVYIDQDAFVSNMDQNLVCLLEYWGGAAGHAHAHAGCTRRSPRTLPSSQPMDALLPTPRLPPASARAGWYAEANQSKVFMMALDPEEPANYVDNKNGHRLLNLNTGFIVIRKSPAALEMLKLWADETEAHPEWNHQMFWDQCAAAAARLCAAAAAGPHPCCAGSLPAQQCCTGGRSSCVWLPAAQGAAAGANSLGPAGSRPARRSVFNIHVRPEIEARDLMIQLPCDEANGFRWMNGEHGKCEGRFVSGRPASAPAAPPASMLVAQLQVPARGGGPGPRHYVLARACRSRTSGATSRASQRSCWIGCRCCRGSAVWPASGLWE
jgi:hypothetical protein